MVTKNDVGNNNAQVSGDETRGRACIWPGRPRSPPSWTRLAPSTPTWNPPGWVGSSALDSSVVNSVADPVGSETFCRIRSRIRKFPKKALCYQKISLYSKQMYTGILSSFQNTVRVYRATLSFSHEGSGVGAETSLKVGSGSGSEKNHSGIRNPGCGSALVSI